MVRKNPLLGLRSNEKERQIWGISDKTKTNSTEGLEFDSVALAVVQGNGYGGLERERERRWWYMACETDKRNFRGNLVFSRVDGVLW